MRRCALRPERVGPLPLVNHFIQRVGVEDVLDRYVPSDARCAVPHARALGVVLRSIIVEREPIYRQQETVQAFASGMFGIAAGEMEHLGDDPLWRPLVPLFVTYLVALLTPRAVPGRQRFNLEIEVIHKNLTSHYFFWN